MDDNEQLSAEEQALLAEMQAAENNEPEQVEAPPEAQGEQPEEDQQPERPKMVPHAALHEEREKRKEIERRLEEERRARQNLEERANLILQRLQSQQPAQPQTAQTPQLPDREKDPVGYLEARAMQAEAAAEAAKRAFEQRQQQDEQARIVTAIQQHAILAEQQYRATTPDYDAAVAHLRTMRDKELELAGVANPMERQMLMAQEAWALSARALQEQRNPAEVVYNLAKLRGYAPPQQQQQQQQPNPEERLQNISRGQQQARASLGNVRGAGPAGFSLKTIEEMDEKTFAKWLDTATPEQMHTVFGR